MENPLGKSSQFPQHYSPEVLFKVPRNRSDLNYTSWSGVDRWVCYELTWLDSTGTPQNSIAELLVPADSPSIVESKSLKLYLGSFSFERFDSPEVLAERITKDLRYLLEHQDLAFTLYPLSEIHQFQVAPINAVCIDHHSAPVSQSSKPQAELLRSNTTMVKERLYSNLFRSLCPVTSQPDFATVVMEYSGMQISHQELLQYLCSFRNSSGFHEHCCEKIFSDIWSQCRPQELQVTCNFTRRGGIEINPVRSSKVSSGERFRTVRQ
jgi:7-cyano-7-deazaguanine reductase